MRHGRAQRRLNRGNHLRLVPLQAEFAPRLHARIGGRRRAGGPAPATDPVWRTPALRANAAPPETRSLHAPRSRECRPTRKATTGTPAAKASRITRGVASTAVDGTTKRSSVASTSSTFSFQPANSTGRPSASASRAAQYRMAAGLENSGAPQITKPALGRGGMEHAGRAQEIRLSLFRRDAADHADAEFAVPAAASGRQRHSPHAVVYHADSAVAGVGQQRRCHEAAGRYHRGARLAQRPSRQAPRDPIEQAVRVKQHARTLARAREPAPPRAAGAGRSRKSDPHRSAGPARGSRPPGAAFRSAKRAMSRQRLTARGIRSAADRIHGSSERGGPLGQLAVAGRGHMHAPAAGRPWRAADPAGNAARRLTRRTDQDTECSWRTATASTQKYSGNTRQ